MQIGKCNMRVIEQKAKKKILLVCNYFAPENTIAAVRISKLAKYFVKAGYDVDVLTEKKGHQLIDETLLKDAGMAGVTYADNSRWCKAFYNLYVRLLKPHKEKRLANLDNRERINPKTGKIEFYPFETAYPLIGSSDYLAGLVRQIDLARNARRIVDGRKYDVLITSYGDLFSYFFGRWYKRKHHQIPWIFDVRDAIYRYKFIPEYVGWIPKRYEQYAWKDADAIIGVSKGICRRVPRKYRKKVHYISNGYDRFVEDGKTYDRMSDKMSFTYTGSMYGGLQNLSKFFEAVKSLTNDGSIQADKMEFCYAGNESAYEIFRNQAAKYQLDQYCIYCGRLTRKESINLQRQSDVLLMASYDYINNTGGVITGKIFEYMDARRPVVAIVTGDIEKGEVADIINKTNIGICYEQSNDKNDFILLKEYICNQYNHFLNYGQTLYEPIYNEVQRYDYKNITKRYIKVLEKLCGGNG